MKTITRSFAILALLCISVTSYADTVFIKYKSYLIPIDVREELKVVTQNATSIQSTSATLNLFIESGEPNLTAWFEFSQSSQPACASTPPANAATLQSGDNYSLIQSNLLPASTYYYRACAIDDINEISSGEIINFHTANAPTIVSTLAATDTRISSVQLNGRIESGTNITTWFVWGLSNSIQCTSPTAPTQHGGNTGLNRERVIGSLSPNTVYHYRFCGLGTDGTKSGSLVSFRTQASTAIATIAATDVFQETAQLNGSISNGSNITTWFVYNTNNNIQCEAPLNTAESNGDTGDMRSFRLASLTPNTNYFFRMCSLGEDGTKSGAILSFRTLVDPTSLEFISVFGRSDERITYTHRLQAGQNVNTWYVIKDSAFNAPQCSETRLGEKILQAGEENTHTFTGLNDWRRHSYRFCAEDVNGEIASLGGTFRTKRKLNKTYTVICSDTTTYSSENGPMDFIVKTKNRDNAFFAPITVYNEGSSAFTGSLFTRTATSGFTITIPVEGITGPDGNGVDPYFRQGDISDGYNRAYGIILNEPSQWRAKLGCLSIPLRQNSKETQEIPNE